MGYNRFQIGCVIVEYDLFNTATFIQNLAYVRFGIILTQFLETGTSDRCLISIVQNLRSTGFILYSIYPFIFLHSPFNLSISLSLCPAKYFVFFSSVKHICIRVTDRFNFIFLSSNLNKFVASSVKNISKTFDEGN